MRTTREVLDSFKADESGHTAFSNGTMGYGWMENWCYRCTNDKDAETPRPENSGIAGCPIIAAVLLENKVPAEWLCETERDAIFGNYHCIEFRPDDEDGGEEPQPEPPLPGQEELLPREAFERPRMFVDATPQHVGAAS